MNAAIIFKKVGQTKTGKGLYKLVHRDGHVFGSAFIIIEGQRKRKQK